MGEASGTARLLAPTVLLPVACAASAFFVASAASQGGGGDASPETSAPGGVTSSVSPSAPVAPSSTPTTPSSSSSGAPTQTSGASMPRVLGLTLDEARDDLGDADVEVEYVLVGRLASDRVIRQEPAAGAPATSSVRLVVQKQAERVTVSAAEAGASWEQRGNSIELSSSSASPVDLSVPADATRLEGTLAVTGSAGRCTARFLTEDRALLTAALSAGATRPVRIALTPGAPLQVSSDCASQGLSLTIDAPEVWVP